MQLLDGVQWNGYPLHFFRLIYFQDEWMHALFDAEGYEQCKVFLSFPVNTPFPDEAKRTEACVLQVLDQLKDTLHVNREVLTYCATYTGKAGTLYTFSSHLRRYHTFLVPNNYPQSEEERRHL